MATAASSSSSNETPGDLGHSFIKKTFHKPTYCHNCTDMLWGLMQQGSVCEVCNFVAHDRCLKHMVTPCRGVAANLIKNPVSHCWTSVVPQKRKFCNVCRKRCDSRNQVEVYCEICEYYAHADCVEFALANCKEIDLYMPGKPLSTVNYQHHWREGNLPNNAKCILCKKTCWSSECLSGYRCEWCGICCHAACKLSIPDECQFGALEPIYLPPHAVSVPRTEVPIEAIIGITKPDRCESQNSRATSDEMSCAESSRCDLDEKEPANTREPKHKEKEDRDEETIKIYDGDVSVRKGIYRTVTVSRLASTEHILNVILEALHIDRSSTTFYLTDVYHPNEAKLADPSPIMNLHRKEGKRPAICLKFKDFENSIGKVRIYSGKLQTKKPHCVATVDDKTSVTDLIKKALPEFGLENAHHNNYRISQVFLDSGVCERVLDQLEKPWQIMKQVGKDSIHRMEIMRFYLQLKQDPHGTCVTLFVGNLPKNISERNYETFLTELIGKDDDKNFKIGPIYYEFGSLVITFEEAKKAVAAFYKLREAKYDNRSLLVMLLPSIEPSMIPSGVKPLLVFVNVQSGGCQGLELISRFRKVLNPYQVFNLVNGGPLPGLYVFRHIKDYRILVCGGDGTVGWVLQCLDNVGQDSECSSPPCGIVPLGTGNDLSRVLRWGSGYNGNGNILSLLKGVIDAEEIRLDRWTVVLYPDDKPDPSNASGSAANTPASEEKSGVLVMNNYFGIGVDADLCLSFHNARKENPQKFQSRLGNKQMYFRMGLRKMLAPSGASYEQLHRNIKLEVDNKMIELPAIEGLIILNILSWGSGANPWGNDREDKFATPNHYDGMLEVVGVCGVMHLGQIQSGIRAGLRIAQGGHIKIHLGVKTPIQIDGEPTKFGPGEIVILKSALKATMLKKNKGRQCATTPSSASALNGEQRKSLDET